ncbi:MAG TPA: hypothetical protein VMK53_09880 [Gemmatimonadales bacterium]|nr:hypothetical protein [Gemmatimonadales bacterium]
MLTRLFPEQIDNDHRGHVLAIWILALLAPIKLLQGANVAGLLGAGKSRHILETADRVPVSAFPAEAASHLVFLFAAWGLGVFVLGLLGIVVLLRYRAMIPLMYLLLLIEQVGRKTLSTVHLDRPFLSLAASPANLINWGFLSAIVIGLVLSLYGRRRPKN